MGRAYFELADYPRAKAALELMQQVQPHRLAGLEVLSTALWHLKHEVDLAFLAQKVRTPPPSSSSSAWLAAACMQTPGRLADWLPATDRLPACLPVCLVCGLT